MIDNDLLISIFIMSLLFLRQIVILKKPNKLNYAPLMIGIGLIGSIIHFILHPEITDLILMLRESLLPLLVSIFFYIIMNILHQTQTTQSEKHQNESTKIIVEQVLQMKQYMSELESRMNSNQEEDRKAQEYMREEFIKDIQALDAIQTNQARFLEKFDDMSNLNNNVSKAFEHFANVQLPELDNVVHKHIDILRVAEQDHYNQTKVLLKGIESRGDMSQSLNELKSNLNMMQTMAESVANDIVKQTSQKLSTITGSVEEQMTTLKSHSESVRTSLFEGENRLVEIRSESENLMKQMVLSSKKMSEIESQNSELHNVYATIKELVKDIEMIKVDYVKSQSQLNSIASELHNAEKEQITTMKSEIETLSKTLANKIDESLEKLHEHYHIADGDITQSVQLLAKRAQLKSGYSSN